MTAKDTLLGSLQDGLWHSLDKLKKNADEAFYPLTVQCETLLSDTVQFEGNGDSVRWKTPQPLLASDDWGLSPGCTVVLTEIDGSTSDTVRHHPMPDGFLIAAAEAQICGRGRRGEPWMSPAARNLYFSIRYRLAAGADYPHGLSLAIGIALAAGLRELGAAGVAVKWPNDIYLDDKKMGGVLCELRTGAEGECDVVVGVGVNVNMVDYAIDVGQPWISLAHVLGWQDRNKVMSLLLIHLFPLLKGGSVTAQESITNHWPEYDLMFGRRVRAFLSSGEGVVGTGAGVGEGGAFLLETDQGRLSLDSADARLRLL